MEEGINTIKPVEEFDNPLTEEIDLDYVKAKLEHNQKVELAEVEEAIQYLKTDLKLKLNRILTNNYGTNEITFFNDLTSKHIELMALTFVKWFIEEPESVESELEGAILENEYHEEYTSETTVLNILDTAINNKFIELAPDNYKLISNEEMKALKEL